MKTSRVVFVGALCVALALGFSISARADGTANQAAQSWPIQLGTSGGNVNDISTMYCCSGTLGSLVQDGNGALYILSNNHVLADSNQGQIGDGINQPGMVDQQCGQSGVLANLSSFVSLKFKNKGKVPLNQVDAAIALAQPGAVQTDGSILGIGPVSANTVAPYVGQAVQKSGRTTGLTVGQITAVDVTVDVGYSKTCGGASNEVARFVNQISISPGSFSAAGDSGSLIVESGATDPTDNLPRAVGLLFAGSSSVTIANPINNVLAALGVAMIGGVTPTGSAPPTSSGGHGKSKNHSLAQVRAIKARHSDQLFAIPGVRGHGIGISPSGATDIQVYVEKDNAATRSEIPHSIEGVPVQIVVTGAIKAY